MKYLLLAVLFLLISTASVGAQTDTIDLSISSIPSDPIPGQQVRLEVVSYSTNLNQASITWRYNNQVVASGIGATRATVTAPAAGQTGTVLVSVTGSGFMQAAATLVLRAASIDLLWEAIDSYTPPFYKGKALPSTNAVVRVTAVPSFSAPRNIAYTWSHNNANQPSSSGTGKYWYTFKNSELNSEDRINVSAEGGYFSGNGSLTIIPRNPSLIAYQKYDGFIDYAHGTTNAITSDQEGMIIRLEPYFFSIPKSINQDLQFAMQLGEQSVAGGQYVNEIRLSRPDTGGKASFRVLVNTITYSLQNLDRLFTIVFS